MISFAFELAPLIQALKKAGITPIFVGGCVRDALLGRSSNDFDIELYGVGSHHPLETILAPFGKINAVGKSFGVYKLSYQGYEIDFSLPRTEKALGTGHKDFEILVHETIDFSEAAKRRDFTINAMGYNPLTQTLLDPYGGQNDLTEGILRCVDPLTFVEDPLRVLRAVQFTARFNLTCDAGLLALCQTMICEGALKNLPKERIFEEIKKLLFSPRPSIGLKLLDQMGGSYLFSPISWAEALLECDTIAAETTYTPKERLALMLTVLVKNSQEPLILLNAITNEQTLITQILRILHHTKRYGILRFPPKTILQGRDLIALGVVPSIRFKSILDSAYTAQMQGEFSSHEEALVWLKNHLVTSS